MTGSDASYLDDMLSYGLDAIELGEADAAALASDKMRGAASGLRDVLIHGYAGLDLTILADTVRIQSPSLIDDRRRALGKTAP
jgi:hypothetical protein